MKLAALVALTWTSASFALAACWSTVRGIEKRHLARCVENAWEAHLANVPGLDDQAEYRAARDVTAQLPIHPSLCRELSDANVARVLAEWSHA